MWSLLSDHSAETEAESILNRCITTRNGRRAWQALLTHMESDSYVDNLKSSDMHKISIAINNGEINIWYS